MAYNGNLDLGTFYGYADGSNYGRYSCRLKWDNVVRDGLKVTMINARLCMTRYSTGYTTNRIAFCAGVGGDKSNVAYNITLNAYNNPSKDEITYNFDDHQKTPVFNTSSSSFSFYIEIACTGGSSNWNNFLTTRLSRSVPIACPPANPTYTKAPAISEIQENSLVISRGTTNISSKFYYKQTKDANWIELTADKTMLNDLTPNTQYTFEFKAANTNDTSLETKYGSTLSATTERFPYVISKEIEILKPGETQKITIHNPLSRYVVVRMAAEKNGAELVLWEDSTTTTTINCLIENAKACEVLAEDKTDGDAYYYCIYGDMTTPSITGKFAINEADCKPIWSEVKAENLIKYKDGNEEVVEISENNQKLYQKYSTLYYGINYAENSAKSNYGSSIEKYRVSINGAPYIDVTASSTEATINSGIAIAEDAKNITIAVIAIDKRGLISEPIERKISVYPYTKPTGTIEVTREGGYGDVLVLKIRPVWGINNNNAYQASYKYTEEETSTSSKQFYVQNIEEPIRLTGKSNDSKFTFEVVLFDKLGGVSDTIYGSVGPGQPILFIDSMQVGVGVNCFPDGRGLYVDGYTNLKGSVDIEGNLNVTNNVEVQGYLLAANHRNKVFERDSERRSGWYYEGGSE